VVQAALTPVMERVFPSDLPCESGREKVVVWMAGVIARGMTRVYAVKIEESATGRQERILDLARERIEDPDFIRLLGNVLESTQQQASSEANFLAPVLANIVLQKTDQVLQQVKVLGRHGSCVH